MQSRPSLLVFWGSQFSEWLLYSHTLSKTRVGKIGPQILRFVKRELFFFLKVVFKPFLGIYEEMSNPNISTKGGFTFKSQEYWTKKCQARNLLGQNFSTRSSSLISKVFEFIWIYPNFMCWGSKSFCFLLLWFCTSVSKLKKSSQQHFYKWLMKLHNSLNSWH